MRGTRPYALIAVLLLVPATLASGGEDPGDRGEDLEHERAVRDVEKAEENLDVEDAEALAERFLQNQFTLEDMQKQIRQVRRMGPLKGIMKMLPGLGGGALDRGVGGQQQVVPLEQVVPVAEGRKAGGGVLGRHALPGGILLHHGDLDRGLAHGVMGPAGQFHSVAILERD